MISAIIGRARTSQISKLLEKLVSVHLNAHLSLIETLPPVQSAYRHHHSTETVVDNGDRQWKRDRSGPSRP